MEVGSGTRRTVNPTEATVLSALFEARPGSDSERIRRSGVPQSTFLDARKRLYDRGWVRDSYIPDPSIFGFKVVSFLMARPFAEQLEDTVKRLAGNPSSVVVWSGDVSVFAVVFARSLAGAHQFKNSLPINRTNQLWTVDALLDSPTVPCYFDFEGVWKNLTGRPGVNGYPRSLGREASWITGKLRSSGDMAAAARLVRRPFLADANERPAHLMGPYNLPRSERKLVKRGWVQWRVLPAVPAFLAKYHDRLNDVVFVHGTFLPKVRSADLFGQLLFDCQTFPFLYATNGQEVFSVSLGTRIPSMLPRPVLGERRSVMGVLRGCLEGIEVVREPLPSVRVHVDHRYDRLLPHAVS
jgi:hypothetical protein